MSAATERTPRPTASGAARLDASALIRAIHEHRRSPSDRPGYWDEYCALVAALCRAQSLLFVQRDRDARWIPLGRHAEDDAWLLRAWESGVNDHGERALQNGFAFVPMHDGGQRLHVFTLVRANGMEEALLVMDIPERERAQLNELILRAALAADFPGAGTAAGPADAPAAPQPQRTEDPGLLPLLDLAADVMGEERFDAAALMLVNGLATHARAAQAALGWRKGNVMRVAAVSHLDRFERNTQGVRLLEDVLFDAMGDPGEAWFRADTGGRASQEALGEAIGYASQCTIPVRDAGGVTRAVVLLAFDEEAPEGTPTAGIAAVMDLLLPWLQYLNERTRWWGARLAASVHRRLARYLGPDRVWTRTFTAAALALLAYVSFGTWEYRIEAPAQLTTDSARFVSAQLDGRLEEVFVTAGDVVKEGAVLAMMDTRELRQQEIDIRAERQRLTAEADKARAAGNLAELAIAEARRAQAEARLARVLHYLEQSRFVAPFDGVIVDGERKELLNAPVKKGDKVFRVARIEGLYVEVLVPERDIRHIRPEASGELRLLSRPDQKIPITLSVFIPMARVKGQEGNHFLVKAQLGQAPEDWWRPGMTGTALIDAGERNIAWILTHRAIDTLRMKLWWLW